MPNAQIAASSSARTICATPAAITTAAKWSPSGRRRPEGSAPAGGGAAVSDDDHDRPRRDGRRTARRIWCCAAPTWRCSGIPGCAFCCSATKPASGRCSPSCRGWRAVVDLHHTERDGDGRRQAVGGIARRAPVEHAAGDRRGRRGRRRRRRLGRQHRRPDGDGQIRAEDLAGDRPAGDRLVLSDPARRERDARPRRQCRMRRRQSGSVRAAWATPLPAPCWGWSSRPSGCSMSARRIRRATTRCAPPACACAAR